MFIIQKNTNYTMELKFPNTSDVRSYNRFSEIIETTVKNGVVPVAISDIKLF